MHGLSITIKYIMEPLRAVILKVAIINNQFTLNIVILKPLLGP